MLRRTSDKKASFILMVSAPYDGLVHDFGLDIIFLPPSEEDLADGHHQCNLSKQPQELEGHLHIQSSSCPYDANSSRPFAHRSRIVWATIKGTKLRSRTKYNPAMMPKRKVTSNLSGR